MPREDVGFFKKREFINFTNLLSHLTDTLHFFSKIIPGYSLWYRLALSSELKPDFFHILVINVEKQA